MSVEEIEMLQITKPPECEHKWTFPEAFTTVVSHENFLYAGTVSGHLVTYDLETYQEVSCIPAHTGSILTLIVQDDMLFSGSSDSLIKVWKPKRKPEFLHLIYMLSDIGDIFSMAYNSRTKTLYIGAQNASIHWVCIANDCIHKLMTRKIYKMPAVRPSKFFDSIGPGGLMAPQQHASQQLVRKNEDSNENLVEIPLDCQVLFAHHSSVYAMLIDEQRNMMITGSGDGYIKIWHFDRDGRPMETHCINVKVGVLSMSLISSWQLCCGLESNGIVLVDLETLQTMKLEVDHHLGPVVALATSSDCVFMASDSDVFTYDTCARTNSRWSAPGILTGMQILSRPNKSNLLVTASSDGSINLWNIHIYDDNLDLDDIENETRTKLDGLDDVDDSPGILATPGTPGTTGTQETAGTVRLHKRSCKFYKAETLGDDAMISFLRRIIKFQTVSNGESGHWSESRRCATALRKQMRHFGADTELFPIEKGNPIVYARFNASPRFQTSDCPTVLYYGHYDVIDARKDNMKWDTPPFQLTSVNGYLYGRGVTDDKGPCTAALYAVANLVATEELSCNVVFLIEGEEESGSYGLMEAIEEHRDLIGKINWILFSNSTWLNDQIPCLNYGLRGVISAEIEVQGVNGDLHSGVAGGIYKEPTSDLIHVLSKLTNGESGEVLIPQFYDNVLPVTDAERALYDDITTQIVLNTETSLADELMRRWRFPSLTLHKLDVSGPKNMTVIPNSATAFISLRLVPSQTADEVVAILEDYILKEFEKLHSPNTLKLRIKNKADPWIGDPNNTLFKVMKSAVETVWTVPPLMIREGGSIPAARALEKILDAPAAQLPCGQSSDNAHLNNERLRVENLLNARRVFEQIFKDIQ